jgi:hypothetical protein
VLPISQTTITPGHVFRPPWTAISGRNYQLLQFAIGNLLAARLHRLVRL